MVFIIVSFTSHEDVRFDKFTQENVCLYANKTLEMVTPFKEFLDAVHLTKSFPRSSNVVKWLIRSPERYGRLKNKLGKQGTLRSATFAVKKKFLVNT